MAQVLSSETLSYNYSPGQDKLYQSTNTDSIFTFGDFRLERTLNSNILENDSRLLSFDRFQSLTGLTTPEFDATRILYIQENDLNPDMTDPNSYSYFGSYYSRVARALNNIVDKYPYAILSYDSNTGTTNVITLTDDHIGYTELYMASSAFTNQANYIYTSGYTFSPFSGTSKNLNLFDNFDKFEIQLSSTTMNTSPSYPILSYSYSAVSNYYHLYFKIAGVFTANTTDAVYIRPSKKRYFQYKRTLSNLEYQLLENGEFQVPNASNDTFFLTTVKWPRLIDGFSPDSYGATFDAYSSEMLKYAEMTDRLKTNWMVRAIIPENYLELDSDGSIYQKLMQVYGEEFDQIKVYIDNLAYAHSVSYSNTETIPDKLLYKLSSLLGWSQPINFTDTDFFEFLGVEDDSNKTLDDYNLDLWRRILSNINWLYKKKGTRDAVMFIFKIIGAPECLINFDEFVYKVKKSTQAAVSSIPQPGLAGIFPNLDPDISGDVNQYGYPNYTNSELAFQEGGFGRGNGDAYIDQFRDNFNPVKTVDNIKSYTGDSAVYGSMDTINSKQVSIGLDPAGAIECDVFDWYKLGFFYTGNTSVNLPSDYKISNISPDLIAPPEISGWTISEWLNFIYENNIDARTRKTSPEPYHNYFYLNLRKIYLTYYYWNKPNEVSSQVNFRKLEQFLKLIENKLGTYIEQLIPATTIFDGLSTIYRNTEFNRQKFVYPKGINDGSEFQIKYPDQFFPVINGAVVKSKVNDIHKGVIASHTVSGKTNDTIKLVTKNVQFNTQVVSPFNPVINAFSTTAVIFSANTMISPVIQHLEGSVIIFPLSGSPIGTPPPTPQPYTGNTRTGRFGPASSVNQTS
jgi:hypothetical protein